MISFKFVYIARTIIFSCIENVFIDHSVIRIIVLKLRYEMNLDIYFCVHLIVI